MESNQLFEKQLLDAIYSAIDTVPRVGECSTLLMLEDYWQESDDENQSCLVLVDREGNEYELKIIRRA